jgi:hypothetical protein
MNTPLIVLCALTVLTGLGLVVAVLDALPFGVETYTISTRQLPNTVADHRSDTSREVRS